MKTSNTNPVKFLLIFFILQAFSTNLHSQQEIPAVDVVALLKQARAFAKEENVPKATEFYYLGLKNLGNHPYADTLFWENYDIMTYKERQAFKKAEDRGTYLLTFWQRQDPTPATVENERLVEHWERLDYARQWYDTPEPRGYDDRGMIYIRYGPPDSRTQMVVPGNVNPNECWSYYTFGREIVFDFVYRASVYRLLFDINEITTVQSPDVMLECLSEFLLPRRDMSRHYLKLEAKVERAKKKAAAIVNDPTKSNQSIVQTMMQLVREIQQDFREVIQENIFQQNSLPHVASSASKPADPLRGAVSYARFFDEDETRLEIYYGVPYEELGLQQKQESYKSAVLDIAYAIRDSSDNIHDQRSMSRTIRVPEDASYETMIYISQINKTLPPGRYSLSFEIKAPQSNKAFEQTHEIRILRASHERLQVSDIQLAHNIEPATGVVLSKDFVKKDLSVMPYPSFSISRRQSIHLYFEVYNLMFGGNGTTSYEIEHSLRSSKTGLLRKILPFGKKESQSTTYQLQGSQRNTQEYFALDFGKVKTGEYELSIKVKDLVAGTSQTSEVQVKVIE